jgi:hypothetical protein
LLSPVIVGRDDLVALAQRRVEEVLVGRAEIAAWTSTIAAAPATSGARDR